MPTDPKVSAETVIVIGLINVKSGHTKGTVVQQDSPDKSGSAQRVTGSNPRQRRDLAHHFLFSGAL